MATFKLRKCYVVLSICLFLPAFSLFAQQHFSLQNLIDSAKKNLPVLQQKLANINIAKASVQEVKHSFLPRVIVTDQIDIGSDNNIPGSYLPGITPSTISGIRSANNYQPATDNIAVLYGEYDLVTFGLKNAKIKNAQSFINLFEADFQQQLYYIKTEVARLYFNILKSVYKLNVDQQNVERYKNIYIVIQALTASGIKAGSDFSLAKAELSKTNITFNQTLGTLNTQQQQLACLTGIPANKLLIDTLVSSTDNLNALLPNFAMDTLNNPLIDYYLKKKNTFVAQGIVIKKSFFPKIMLAGSSWAKGSSITYNDEYKSLSTGLGYQRFNYELGIGISYNLFTGTFKKDKLAINKYQVQASDYELQQQKLLLTSASLQADNALQTVKANLLELPVQLQSAQDTYQQKLAQYKAGIISLIDLTNASFVLYRSQTDYIETVSDLYLAQLDKAIATGNLTQFIQSIK